MMNYAIICATLRNAIEACRDMKRQLSNDGYVLALSSNLLRIDLEGQSKRIVFIPESAALTKLQCIVLHGWCVGAYIDPHLQRTETFDLADRRLEGRQNMSLDEFLETDFETEQ